MVSWASGGRGVSLGVVGAAEDEAIFGGVGVGAVNDGEEENKERTRSDRSKGRHLCVCGSSFYI